jgi:endonuclease/exonuclease/phosphatase family metal-dependent hydrolase
MQNDEVKMRGWRSLVWLVAMVVAVAAKAQLPAEIRVVTYNVHHGEGTDGKWDLPRIAGVLKRVKPDILALQEVDQGTKRSSGVDQPAEFAKLLDMEVVYGRNIDYDGGGYGTAVLSKLPVKSHASHKLKSFYESTPEHAEQRGVQVVELGPKDGPGIVFFCTHLDYRPPDEERWASVATINQLADKYGYGDQLCILTGDLNATPESRVIKEFDKTWKRAGGDELLSFPSDKPARLLDYIYVRPPGRWEVVEARVLDEGVASDHRPVLAVLRWKP